MIKAVVFDMDGTLFDTERIYQIAWRITALEFGMAEERIGGMIEALTGRNTHDSRAYFEKHLADVSDYDTFIGRRGAHYDAQIEAIGGIPFKPGVHELMQYLKQNGIKIALATATRKERTLDNLQKTGLYDCFDVIVTGDMVTNGKPHPETFLTAAELLGFDPKECMGVEDSFNGIQSVSAAGLLTVMVPDVKQPTPEIAALLDYRCENLLEICDILENLNQNRAN